MKSLFIRNHPSETPIWKIIVWWELRRIIFNLICIPILYYIWVNIDQTVDAGAGGSPIFYVLYIVFFLLFINISYTFFWITDIIIKAIKKGNITTTQRYLFISSFIFTLLISKFILEVLYA